MKTQASYNAWLPPEVVAQGCGMNPCNSFVWQLQLPFDSCFLFWPRIVSSYATTSVSSCNLGCPTWPLYFSNFRRITVSKAESLSGPSQNPYVVCSRYGYGSIPIDTFLVGWTSIYQLFWGSLGTRVLTHPHMGTHWKSKASNCTPQRVPTCSAFMCQPCPASKQRNAYVSRKKDDTKATIPQLSQFIAGVAESLNFYLLGHWQVGFHLSCRVGDHKLHEYCSSK